MSLWSLLLACDPSAQGVEETGYLTDEGVYFTASEEGRAYLAVAPTAASALGGTLSAELSSGGSLPEKTLGDAGILWELEGPADVVLTYDLDGTDRREVVFTAPSGDAPTEDPLAAGAWLYVESGEVVFAPAVLVEPPPYLVVDLDSGSSLWAGTRDPVVIVGQVGDEVCVSSALTTSSSAALCRFAE